MLWATAALCCCCAVVFPLTIAVDWVTIALKLRYTAWIDSMIVRCATNSGLSAWSCASPITCTSMVVRGIPVSLNERPGHVLHYNLFEQGRQERFCQRKTLLHKRGFILPVGRVVVSRFRIVSLGVVNLDYQRARVYSELQRVVHLPR